MRASKQTLLLNDVMGHLRHFGKHPAMSALLPDRDCESGRPSLFDLRQFQTFG